jgi:hypothetical protein
MIAAGLPRATDQTGFKDLLRKKYAVLVGISRDKVEYPLAAGLDLGADSIERIRLRVEPRSNA